MWGWIRLSVWLALVVAAGCSLLTPMDEARHDLERARQRWEAQGLDRYRYLVRRACECLVETTGPFEVRVEPGAEPVVTHPQDGQPVATTVAVAFPDVDGLFSLIEDAFLRGAYRVEADYDPETGVPLRLSIDWDEGLADEELLYWSTVPEPLAD